FLRNQQAIVIHHLTQTSPPNKFNKERVSVLAYKVGRCLLRYRLQDSNMTQQELADAMSISVQQINKYVLNKQRMSIEVARNIAVILNCHIEDLYEWCEVGNSE